MAELSALVSSFVINDFLSWFYAIIYNNFFKIVSYFANFIDFSFQVGIIKANILGEVNEK